MKLKRIFLAAAAVLALFAVALLTEYPAWYKYKKGNVRNFNECSVGDLKEGDLVKGYIDLTDGMFAEQQETKKHFGITTSKSTTMKYYSVSLKDRGRIIYGTGKSSDYSVLDRIDREWTEYLEKMYDGMESEEDRPTVRLAFEGEVHKMPDDLQKIIRNCFSEDPSVKYESVIFIRTATFDDYQAHVFIGFGLAGGAVLMLILFIVFTIRGKKGAQYGY